MIIEAILDFQIWEELTVGSVEISTKYSLYQYFYAKLIFYGITFTGIY